MSELRSEGGPEEARAVEAQIRFGLDYSGTYLTALPPPPHRRRRKALRLAVRAVAYGAAAAAVFMAGWLVRGALDGGSSVAPSTDQLTAELLPEKGISLDVTWGDIPKRLVQDGVIDLEKFETAARNSGLPLTDDQMKVLTEGSDASLHIDAENAYFLLDVLWAVGLANKNPVLADGPLAQRGWDAAGSYASTGGWTLGMQPGPSYLASLDLIKLSDEQQAVMEEVAYNSYRTCCGNMTAFPDCNHGMAALGLVELMASQGASADEIFEALKRVSPFWFPTQYHHLAMYFENQGQEWETVEPRLLMGQTYSSSNGWKQVAAELQQQGVLGGDQGGKVSGCAT